MLTRDIACPLPLVGVGVGVDVDGAVDADVDVDVEERDAVVRARPTEPDELEQAANPTRSSTDAATRSRLPAVAVRNCGGKPSPGSDGTPSGQLPTRDATAVISSEPPAGACGSALQHGHGLRGVLGAAVVRDLAVTEARRRPSAACAPPCARRRRSRRSAWG